MMSNWKRSLWRGAALAVGYFLAGRLGKEFAFEDISASPVWPASGVAVAGLLILGMRFWPAVLAGALAINLIPPAANSFVTSFLVALGNTLEAVAATWLLRRRLGFRESLERLRDMLALLGAAALGATMVSATIGVTALCVERPKLWTDFATIWRNWWLGDAQGVVLVAPLILLWSQSRRLYESRRHLLKSAALMVLVATVAWLVFFNRDLSGPFNYSFWLFPLFSLLALRFTMRQVVETLVIAEMLAILGTVLGLGPFSRPGMSELQRLVHLQLYLGVLSAMSLVLSVLRTELRHSQERLQAIFDNEPDCVKLVGADGLLIEINSAGLKMIDADSPDEVIGRCVYDVVAPKDRNAFRELNDRVCRGEPGELEYDIVGLKGTRRTIQCRSVPLVYWPDGHFVQLALARDVTERKTLEGQIRHSQKMEAVGRLAGGVAHDFNNILTVIMSHAEMGALLAEQNPEVLAAFDKILDASLRSARLTRQLLVFSRRQVLQPKVLDVNDVVRSLQEMLERLIGEQIELLVETSERPLFIRVDPGQLEQVLLNLCLNARDAMPDGGRIVIRTREVSRAARLPADAAEGSLAQIEISDTGHGMDEDTRARIFEPFFTTKSAGTGLGLSIVHGIVHQSGGTIEVTSAPGQGTTVRIELPLVEPERPPLPAPRAALPGRNNSETILVAEDDDTLRPLICAGLRQRNYTVLEARDGAEALQVAGTHAGQVHLLLTDMVMRGVGGRELADRLQSARPETHVLLMSGYTDDPQLQADIVEGEIAFIQKPFTPDVLAHRIRNILDAAVRP